jgi:hypothetical protein
MLGEDGGREFKDTRYLTTSWYSDKTGSQFEEYMMQVINGQNSERMREKECSLTLASLYLVFRSGGYRYATTIQGTFTKQYA